MNKYKWLGICLILFGHVAPIHGGFKDGKLGATESADFTGSTKVTSAIKTSGSGLRVTRHVDKELSFIPYVSSYLRLSQGELFFGNERRQYSENFSTAGLNPANRLPVIDRFDALRSRVLGRASVPRSQYGKDLFNSRAQSWEGVCDQWSAASLQPAIARLLQDLPPITCEGITLYPGEVREIFTAFFQHVDRSLFLGKRTRDAGPISAVAARRLLGKDDLDPEEFTQQIIDNLSADRGVVADLSDGEDVWNYPVYKIDTTSRRIEHLKDLQDPYLDETASYLFRKIPAEILTSTDPKIRRLIDDIDKLESRLDNEVHLGIRKATRSENILDKARSTLQGEAIQNETQTLTETTIEMKNELSGKRSLGADVSLKRGIVIDITEVKLDVMKESAFSEGFTSNPKANSAEARYLYFTVLKNGQRVESRWLSDSHPDFLWVPSQIDLNSPQMKKYMPWLNDLVAIIEKCKPAQRVSQFYKQFYSALKDERISPEERKSLAALSKGIESLLDKPFIVKSMRQAKDLNEKDLAEILGK